MENENSKSVTPVTVVLSTTITIPEYSEVEVFANLVNTCVVSGQDYLVEDNLNCRIMVARAIVQPKSTGNSIVLRLLNPSREQVQLHKGTNLARLEPIPASSIPH